MLPQSNPWKKWPKYEREPSEEDKLMAEVERLKAALNLIACAVYPVYKFDGVQIPEGFVDVDTVRQLTGIAQDALKGGNQ